MHLQANLIFNYHLSLLQTNFLGSLKHLMLSIRFFTWIINSFHLSVLKGKEKYWFRVKNIIIKKTHVLHIFDSTID